MILSRQCLLLLLSLWCCQLQQVYVYAKSKKEPDEPVCPTPEKVEAGRVFGNEFVDFKHYLVGLLHYPQSNIPEILDKKTSGTYLPTSVPFARSEDFPPYDHIPSVGASEIETVLGEKGTPIRGEYYILSDNGYGLSDNSADYALNLMHASIRKPFSYRHGEHTAAIWTPITNIKTVVLHDPHGYIHWTNKLGEVLDIQVEYAAPADWSQGDNDFTFYRTLTGRDFDPEGLVSISEHCSIVGEEFMPSLFAINPKTGVVQSPFVRFPDVLPDLNITYHRPLTTVSDKQHCTLLQVKANECQVVEKEFIDKQGEYKKERGKGGEKIWEPRYKRIDLDEGVAALVRLEGGAVAAFFEGRIDFEPGIRVYKVNPGDCTKTCPPTITAFYGFYRLEPNAAMVAAAASIPGNERRVVVLERNNFPVNGHEFPLTQMPADQLCIVDLLTRNAAGVLLNKRCILNLHYISDPYDVDMNGVFIYGQSQRKNEGLIVLDDYCIMIGTDTDYPFTNRLQLPFDIPYYQEVTDGRYTIICFVERIFDAGYPHFL